MSEEIDTVRLIYTGRISTSGGPLRHTWIEPDSKQQLVFSDITGRAVGDLYEARVTRDSDGRIVGAYPDLTYLGERYDDSDQIAAWWATDQAAYRSDKLRKLENRHRRSPELQRALEPLDAIVRKARTYDEAERIANIVRSELMRHWLS